MVLLNFGLCAIACSFIILSASRLAISRYKKGGVLWTDSSFWLSVGFLLVSLGLLEFCIMRVWQALTTAHIPFVQSPTWAMVASVTILMGLCAKMRVLSINKPETGRRFLIAAALWCVFCAAREALTAHYGLY